MINNLASGSGRSDLHLRKRELHTNAHGHRMIKHAVVPAPSDSFARPEFALTFEEELRSLPALTGARHGPQNKKRCKRVPNSFRQPTQFNNSSTVLETVYFRFSFSVLVLVFRLSSRWPPTAFQIPRATARPAIPGFRQRQRFRRRQVLHLRPAIRYRYLCNSHFGILGSYSRNPSWQKFGEPLKTCLKEM